MKWNDIPEAFVNRENFIRLVKESYQYRLWRNIAAIVALIGWLVVVFLLATK